VKHQNIGNMVRRNEHAIGKRDVAEPAFVKPRQKALVEAAISQVDPHEFGR
jgi:hypothetical protein